MTYPLATLGPTISSTGISAPLFNDIYNSLIATFQGIYGSDIYVDPDSQDGQWIAAIASAINDCNQAAISVFQSFSPSYSQGTNLSSLVKINGMQRLAPTNSQAVGNVGGTVGTVILNGVVKDVNGNMWGLPPSVTIGISGSTTVTVTAQAPGSIAAGIGQINTIYNPQSGWQTFTNTAAATVGNPLETDGALRIRQSNSTAIPARSIIDAIAANVANVPGVGRSYIYENATGATDSNGVPAHSIAPIVEGGSVTLIGQAIALEKPPGIQTYGTTQYISVDQVGLPTTINFFELMEVPIYYAVTIQPLNGYVSTTGVALMNALAAFTAALGIGEDVYASQASAVASLGGSLGATFYISTFYLGTSASPTGTGNVTIAYNAAASCTAANIQLSVA